ncbi:MAG: hypothetical protein K2Y25_16780 [Pseudomonadaceae bacterium]|nr:hypothetical protein [Pseudomonadaceae bacterium]
MQQQADSASKRLRADQLAWVEQKIEIAQKLKELQQHAVRQQSLQQRFALIAERSVLERSLLQTTEAYEQQISLVHAAGSRTVEQIRREQQQVSHKLTELEQELATLSSNLYQHLQQALPPNSFRL